MEIFESLLPSYERIADISCTFGACFMGIRPSVKSASGFVAVVGFKHRATIARFGHFVRSLLPASIPCVQVRNAFGASVNTGAQFVISVPVATDSLPGRALAGPIWAGISYPA